MKSERSEAAGKFIYSDGFFRSQIRCLKKGIRMVFTQTAIQNYIPCQFQDHDFRPEMLGYYLEKQKHIWCKKTCGLAIVLTSLNFKGNVKLTEKTCSPPWSTSGKKLALA